MGSYRGPSDASSRRASDGDHRGPTDGREYWHVSPSRRPSETYRDDRPRERSRDRWDSRDQDREAPRNAFKVPPPKLDTASGRVRNGRDLSTSSASPGHSVTSDTVGHGQALTNFLKNLSELIVERATLAVHRETQEKMLKQRQLEYDKSMPKHTEFPSVPELQNKYRKRDMRQRDELRSHWEKNQSKVDRICQHLADELIRALPLSDMKGRLRDSLAHYQNKDYENRLSTLTETLQQYRDDARKIQGSQERQDSLAKELDSVKAQLAELREQSSRQTQSETDIGHLEKSFRSQLADQQTRFERDMERLRQAHKSDLEQLRREFTAQQESSNTSQSTDLALRLSNQEADIRTLRSDADALQVSVAPLVQSTHHLADRSVKCDGHVSRLSTSVEEHANRLDALETQVKGVDFSQLDLGILDELVEFYTFRWPVVSENVTRIQKEVNSIRETVASRTQQTQLSDSLDESFKARTDELRERLEKDMTEKLDNLTTLIARMVQDLRDKTHAHETRLQAFEKEHSREQRLPSGTPDVTPMKAAIENLDKTYAGLVEQVAQAKEAIRCSSEELRDRTEFLTMSLTSLDTQVNNLSTKNLAEMVIGQLELVYSDPRRLTADMAELNNNYRDLRGMLEEVKADQARLHADLSTVELETNKCNQALVELVGSGFDDGPNDENRSRKKRRIEDDALVNGHVDT